MGGIRDVNSLIERLHRISKIPIRKFDSSGKKINIDKIKSESLDPICEDEELFNKLVALWNECKSPSIMIENDSILYGIMQGRDRYFYIWGPLAIEKIHGVEINRYKHRHNISLDNNFRIQKGDIASLTSEISIVYEQLTGEFIESEKIVKRNSTSITMVSKNDKINYILNVLEKERQQLPNTLETDFMSLIRDGNVDGLKKIGNVSLDSINDVAKSKYKHYEYLAVGCITLCTRAAMEGGMIPKEAYELSDMYLQKLEMCKDIIEIINLTLYVSLDFTKRVKRVKEKSTYSIYIEKSKIYISNNINQKIKLEDIAKEVGVNSSYLSRTFTKNEGVTMQIYIQKERVKFACNMLKNTDESIVSISNYLCFNSQSRFASVFKKHMNMSPLEYRNKYKVICKNENYIAINKDKNNI